MSVTYTTHYEFGKQEDYSDLFSMKVITDNWDSLDTILYAFATGKQDKIDSTHKLDPALVSFSTEQQATLDSGVTTEDVEQIETNKTNIFTVADQSTQYNIVPIKSTITTGNASVTATVAADKSITIEITGTTSTAVGFEISDNFTIDTNIEYVMTGNPSSGAVRLILQQAESPYNWIGQQYNNQAAAVSPNVSLVRYYVYIYANSSGTITIKPMLTPKSLWDKGFTDYQPYAMSNAELTALVLKVASGTYSLNDLTWTASANGMIYSNATSVNGITSIYSAIITGFVRLRATDVIVPILSNDGTQIRFMANTDSWVTDAYVTLRIVGV